MNKLTVSYSKLRYIVIALLVVLVYSNTPSLKYALDDRMIIFENDYTLKGLKGTKEIFTKDAFSGYFGDDNKLVTGGRYRPLSQFTFMVEYDLFGKSIHDKVGMNRAPQNEKLFSESALPIISHSVNVLLMILLCLLTYNVLLSIFPAYDNKKWYLSLPFIATLIFALHPLHTEAVANIKGRDEIMCMLGAMLTVYTIIKYVSRRKIFWLFLTFFSMLFALFSKENAITFLAIVPLVLYFLPNSTKKSDYFTTIIPILLASVLFLAARYYALGGMLNQGESEHILNNPFAQSTKGQEIATVLITWAIYFKLMIFPYPLTHDYYPNVIEITNFSNPLVWCIIAAIGFIIYYAIKKLKKKEVISFGILFFIITFSITSNLLFNVGTFMNERFLFTSLLGFSIILAFLIQKMSQWISGKMISVFLILVLVLFSIDTFARNFVWKDEITLFTTDVKTSSKSIKCNISAGGSYLKLYDQNQRTKYLILAEKHLNTAFQMGHVTNDAYSLLGKVYFLKKDYARSLDCYRAIIKDKPDDQIARDNIKVVEMAAEANQVLKGYDILNKGNIEEAIQFGQQLLKDNPNSPEVLNLMGNIYGKGLGKMDEAIDFLQKAITISPNYASALENLGIAYAMKKQFDLALKYLNQAHAIDPNNQNIIQNIETVKKDSGK